MATSHALANALKDIERRRQAAGIKPWRPPQVERVEVERPAPATVRAHGTLLAAALRHNLTRHMVAWLLMQAMDTTGCGRLPLDEVRAKLTGKRSAWRICGPRRLRMILAEAEGVLWDRHSDTHIWLRGPHRIAEALDTGRLRGNPIALPFNALLGSIGQVRAHFYAAFESGRRSDAPISRPALEQATGVAARTQLEYDKRLGRAVRRNIAVTRLLWTPENAQAVATATTPARRVFRFVDWTGRLFGRPGWGYVAYRLPDSRERVHDTATPGRIRKVNRRIANVVITEGRRKRDSVNAYHPDVKVAAGAYSRDPDRAHHWPMGGSLTPDASRPPKLRGIGAWGVVING